MDKFQSHQIARIISKVKYGIATDDEKRVFEDWVEAMEEHGELYNKIASNESLKEYLKLKRDYELATDYKELQSGIMNSLNKRNQQKRIKRYSFWWGSVAAVLLVGGILMLRYTATPKEEKVRRVSCIAEVTTEPKIQDKVILVSADGEKVGLTKIQQDSMRVGTAVIVGQEDKLVYDSDSEQKTTTPEEPEINKIITTAGGFYSLVLSDGTKVWLNSESELEYPVLFGKGKRVVRLAGEAYFEVAKDASRPFIVETSDICTKVLGTSFNIKAYRNESSVAATLFTGKVEVSLLTDTLRKVVLSPGKQADWDLQTKQLSVAEVNLTNIIAWKEGMFMFNTENIEVVTRQIERWYDVKFIYEANSRKKYTFNGYFSKDESLKTILDALTFTGGPKFEINENMVYVKD